MLEPIGYDANCGFINTILLTSKKFVNNENIHLKSIFSDTTLVRRYISELERISNEEYLDKFFEKNIELYNNNRQILSSEFRSEDYSTSFIYKKAEVISCKDVTFRFLGFSLATINTIISIILSGIMIRIIKNYGKN